MNFGRVGFVMEGDWSAAVTYDTLSVVLYEGAVYVAKRMSAGSEPSTHPADWLKWVESPVVSAEQTENGYDLTITNGDGTTSVVHLLNGQITEAELTTALSGLREAFNANISEGYSSSSVYSEGDYCLYNNVLYRCTADILTPEAWDSDHWETASLADDVQDLSENLYNNKADAITSTASGEIVTIADGGKDLPVVDLKVSLLPVQSGSGDPSPDNVRPISGWTGANLYRTGDNIFGGNLLRDGLKAALPSGSDDPDYRRFEFKSTATVEQTITKASGLSGRFKENTQYTFILTIRKSSGGGSNLRIYYTDGTNSNIMGYSTNKSTIATVSSAGKTVLSLGKYNSGGTTYLYYDESGVFEGVLTADDFKPYVGTTYPISWQSTAGTVYGGSLDVSSGVLTVDTQSIQIDSSTTIKSSRTNAKGNFSVNYNLEDLGYPFGIQSATANQIICDKLIGNRASDIYNQGNATGLSADGKSLYVMADNTITSVADYTTWMTNLGGITVLYPLAESIIYQLDPVQIQTLLGVNNFWSNSNGVVDLEYRCDTKLYIENLTKPSKDDMTANANIASGKFFMVGSNALFLSTTAISQGEKIVEGTNCTRLSLADALNQINS